MLKLYLANAIFAINYPRKKNCSVLYSKTYLPCHLLPVGVSHLLGLIPGKKNYIQVTCFMPTYYQSSWAMISILLDLLFELYSQKMQTNMSHLDEENVALGYQNISPSNHLATSEIATKDRT